MLKSFQLSARAFSETIGEKPTITQNYVGIRNSMPGADYLEKVMKRFDSINPTWLLVGEGEPFKEGSAPNQNQTNISGKKNTVAVAGTNNGTATTNNYNLADCEKERDSLRAERDSLAKQVELLNGQLQMQKTIIEGKDQMLDLLKGGFNRPN
ncbi:hypothetical protein GCM10027422_38440 [Hymenobacter arcticus]